MVYGLLYGAFFSLCCSLFSTPYDLSFVGYVKQADGHGRLTIELIDMLKDALKINFVNSHPGSKAHANFKDVPSNVVDIIKQSSQAHGKIAFFTDILFYGDTDWTQAMPDSKIKIAYSMLDSTKIPTKWTKILNGKFDAVIVPDSFIASSYKDSGVTVPIFVIPLPLNLQKLLDKPLRQSSNPVFTFGISALIQDRKNIDLLIDAFAQEFGYKKNVKLKIHGRAGDYPVIKKVYQKLKHYSDVKNIEVIRKPLSENDYVDFLSSLDCYVFLSKGEGFSITPREAMAAGIPVILTNNSSHTTICNSNLVYSVKCPIKEPISYPNLSGNNEQLGYIFNCTVSDARKALRRVYTNYQKYLTKAQQAREWVKQYLPAAIKPQLLSLLKPKFVKLGAEDKLIDGGIVTKSHNLYSKFTE